MGGGAGQHAAGAAPGGAAAPLYAAGVGAGGAPASAGGPGLAALSFCAPPPPSFCPATATLTSVTLPYTGSLTPFTVGADTLSIHARLWGAGGSGGKLSLGGGGAFVEGYLSPTPFPGSKLSILVGGGGLSYPATAAKLGGASISHPSNFGCAGTGAGPSAIALAGAWQVLAVAGAGGSGGEFAAGSGGAAKWGGGAAASAQGGVFTSDTTTCGAGAPSPALPGTAAGPGAGGCGSFPTRGAGGGGPLSFLPEALSNGGWSMECGGAGGGGGFGGGAGGFCDLHAQKRPALPPQPPANPPLLTRTRTRTHARTPAPQEAGITAAAGGAPS